MRLDFVLDKGNYTEVKLLKDIVSSVSDSKILNDFMIYPNPASEQVTANYYSPANKLVITIVNSVGQVCLKLNQLAKVGQNKITLDTKQLQPGIYILNVDNQKAKLIIN